MLLNLIFYPLLEEEINFKGKELLRICIADTSNRILETLILVTIMDSRKKRI